MRFALLYCIAIAACAQDAATNDLLKEIVSLRAASLDVARRLIADPRPHYKAMGADLIRQSGDPWFLHQELLAALGDVATLASDGTIQDDERFLHLAILDTLIQLKAEIPPDIGRALLRRYPAQAAILLYSRGCPDLGTGTFVLDNSRSDEAWLVAARCLSVQRGGPVELLRRFRVGAQVKVFDQNRGEGTYISGVVGRRGWGVLRGTVGSGWNDVHGYELLTGSEAMSGAVLLMPGVHAVYYERGGDFEPSPSYRDRDEDTLDFLASVVAGDKKRLGLEAHPEIQIHWLDAERYQSDLQAFAADQQRRYNALLAQLAAFGLATKQDVERFRLKLDITVIDRRSVRADSIPILGIGDHLN